MTRSTKWVAATVALLSACTADVPAALDRAFFVCQSEEDCGDGWTCAEGSAFGPDYCTRECDPADAATCDGHCTATGECWPACTLNADGTSSRCHDGRTCVRVHADSASGACFPAQGCSTDADCAPGGGQCLTSDFESPATVEFAFDRSYCVASPTSAACPAGYLKARGIGAEPRACTLACAEVSKACPPAQACYTPFSQLFETAGNPCVPGLWGTTCGADSECLLGRCLEVGGGRRACTLRCAEAESLLPSLGCAGMLQADLGVRFECDLAVDGGVCVPLVGAQGLCDASVVCDHGFSCERAGPAQPLQCRRSCASTGDCAVEGTPLYFCGLGGSCQFRRATGKACTADEQCFSNRCETGLCRR